MTTVELIRHNSGFLNVAPIYTINGNGRGVNEQNGDRLETYNLPDGFKVKESQLCLFDIFDNGDNHWEICCADDWQQAAIASANGVIHLEKGV